MQPLIIQARTYLSGAWHYRWLAMIIAWSICLAGWGAIALIPNQFQAVAMIYVDTDSLMAPLLRGLTVSVDPQQQVSVMLNTLLTRPNLEQVVHLTHRDAGTFSATRLANEVETLHDNVSLKPLGTRNLFEMAYTDPNPNHALTVSQSLLSILVDLNIGDKRRDLEGAQAFLDQRIGEYEVLLRQAEQRRADFRSANLDVLSNTLTPDQASANVEKAREDLMAANARLSSLRAQLGAIPKIIYIDGPGPIVLGNAEGNSVSTGGGSSLLQQLAAAKQQLLQLEAHDTPDHPDVKALKRQIAQLEAELAATPTAGVAGSGNQSVPNPVYVQTQSKLSDAETDVAFRAQQLSQAQADLDRAKKMTTRAIAVQTKFADLDRDYGLLHKNYQDLLARREAARMAQAVNDQQSQITVRIVQPPQKAPFPVAPNRPLLNSLVLVAALVAGIGAAVGLSINAGRFLAREQLAAAFDYPIIGVVARLNRLDDRIKATRTAFAMASSFALLLVCYIGVLVTLDATFRGTLQAFL